MESGTPGKSSGDGWLNRALPAATGGSSVLRAVALTNQVPRTLRGEREAIAVGNLDQFKVGNQDAGTIMQSMYATTPDASAAGTPGKDAFEAMKLIQAIQPAPPNFPSPQVPAGITAGPVVPGTPAAVPQYGQGGEFGRNLQQLARLIKAEAGVEAAFAEIGGWDHHSNENQQLSNLLRQFSNFPRRLLTTWAIAWKTSSW